MGPFGAVVGATIGEVDVRLDRLGGPYLVPGIGAQGGTVHDVRRIFGTAVRAVVPSVSREVLRHGPDLEALRAAAVAQVTQFATLRN
jgi:orotidine-5'-phosphate decarboxylase